MNVIFVGFDGVIVILVIFIAYVFASQNTSIDFKQLEYFNISKTLSLLSILMFGLMNQQSILDVF